VEDEVDALHGATHGGRIQQVALADLDVEPGQRAAVAARAREDAHRAALGEKLAHDVRADEAGAPGDERVDHGSGSRGAATLGGWPETRCDPAACRLALLISPGFVMHLSRCA